MPILEIQRTTIEIITFETFNFSQHKVHLNVRKMILTEKKTQPVSIAKIGWSMLFVEIFHAWCKNHAKPINTPWAKHKDLRCKADGKCSYKCASTGPLCFILLPMNAKAPWKPFIIHKILLSRTENKLDVSDPIILVTM